MTLTTRRDFLKAAVAAPLVSFTALPGSDLVAAGRGADLFLSPFRFDVTPPAGHSLCGGWIRPVEACDDPLEAIGFVLLGLDRPVVICAVDWTGILNEAHVRWRATLADAAGTTPDRVAVQCVHQHDAPFACLDTQAIVGAHEELPDIIDVDFFERTLEHAHAAVVEAMSRARRVTHVAAAKGRVRNVASNRRTLGDDGKVARWRGSSTRDASLHRLPEGLIDPLLRTVAFYDGDAKIAACHYYATHPMSYYGRGRVTSDFAGLARKRRQRDEPDCAHVYFTGCAGNIAAGKYNDGSHEARERLTQNLYDGIVDCERGLVPRPIERVTWRTREMLPTARHPLGAGAIEELVRDKEMRVVERSRPAYELAWLRRLERGTPIVLGALALDDISLLHLPAEAFVEYQLEAQAVRPERFVATAAYGDGGPWYIPTAEAYPQGGYEVSVAYCDPTIDGVLTTSIRSLLGA